jgi:hypothetical protein
MSQPQVALIPQELEGINAKWVNGVAPGYSPTKGAGLTLNLGAGTSFCEAVRFAYAGGTLALADNATNYVFLDMTASNVPASNTTGYPITGIPIATVVTLAGVITSIQNDTPFFARDYLDTDGTLAADSDTRIATQKATKTYVDSAIATVDPKTGKTVGITIDGGGSTPTTGSKAYIQVPYGATITGWSLVADQVGSAQITVKKCADGAFPTTASIVASAQPKLTTAQMAESTSVGTWTTAITALDWLEFNLDSVTTCQRLTLELRLTRS